MDVKKVIKQLIKKYSTSNPFKIAQAMGITIVYEDLGSSWGYFSNLYRTFIIHINENLSYEEQFLTCAHELGHIIQHPEHNMAFLKANTFFLTDKYEIEANVFAVELLFSDNDNPITFEEAVNTYGIPEQFLKKFYSKTEHTF
ncbi:ImmA/IrrE family metallo-endopeptidase [Lysinibacillus sphaericus]|uniref:ImmA/IrrE family metallo-endopeptidase n=1 Tax=Lysinibacillus sphaericus TaxID=1421 RepID=UPI003D7FBA3F